MKGPYWPGGRKLDILRTCSDCTISVLFHVATCLTANISHPARASRIRGRPPRLRRDRSSRRRHGGDGTGSGSAAQDGHGNIKDSLKATQAHGTDHSRDRTGQATLLPRSGRYSVPRADTRSGALATSPSPFGALAPIPVKVERYREPGSVTAVRREASFSFWPVTVGQLGQARANNPGEPDPY